MRNFRFRLGIMVFAACGALAGTIAMAAPTIRYCCTPQQVQACAATGGTATCRTGVCQCLF